MSLLRRDRRVQFAAAIGVLEWILMAGLVLVLEEDQRWMLGIVLGASTCLQLIALLWRKAPTDAFSLAQASFMRGEYEETALQLEILLLEDPHHGQAQTLLGNTYRQLGRLDESEFTLQQAVAAAPQDAFPSYGLGRTLLAKGHFEMASQQLGHAVANGSRKATMVELALAQFLANQTEQAITTAKSAARQLQLEPYRVLMVNYLLQQLTQDQLAVAMMQRHAEAGLPYWQAEAQRFADTPYGERLTQELGRMQTIIAKDAMP